MNPDPGETPPAKPLPDDSPPPPDLLRELETGPAANGTPPPPGPCAECEEAQAELRRRQELLTIGLVVCAGLLLVAILARTGPRPPAPS